MNKLQTLIMKHPTRRKYALLVADIIFVLIAIKIFINYTNIQFAIQDTIAQRQQKEGELEFAKNFWLPYEQSEEASVFLKHENNVFLPGEFVIKFQSIQNSGTAANEPVQETGAGHFLTTPQESRQQFLKEKLK